MAQSTLASTPLRLEPSPVAMAALDDHGQASPAKYPYACLSHYVDGGGGLTRITKVITEPKQKNLNLS